MTSWMHEAVREAGHATAMWWLERNRYCGTEHGPPRIRWAAVRIDDGPVDCREVPRMDMAGVVVIDGYTPPEAFAFRSTTPESSRGRTRRRVKADIIHTMAGPIAEHIYSGAPVGHWQELLEFGEENTPDYINIDVRIANLGHKRWHHMRDAFATADTIVRSHLPHIHALAAALAERGRVEGSDVYRILDTTT